MVQLLATTSCLVVSCCFLSHHCTSEKSSILFSLHCAAGWIKAKRKIFTQLSLSKKKTIIPTLFGLPSCHFCVFSSLLFIHSASALLWIWTLTWSKINLGLFLLVLGFLVLFYFLFPMIAPWMRHKFHYTSWNGHFLLWALTISPTPAKEQGVGYFNIF